MDTRKTIYQSPQGNLLVKGLRSNKILEAPVSLVFEGASVGEFQAIEVFETHDEFNTRPLMHVDIIANTFIRSTYRTSSGLSGTLGTSVVAAPALRPLGRELQYVAKVTSANLSMSENRVRTLIDAEFSSLARVQCEREYRLGEAALTFKVHFMALESFELDPSLLGSDAFRFFTISSMYANERYDGNLIRYCLRCERLDHEKDGNHDLLLTQDLKREAYLFRWAEPVRSISLLKTKGSQAPRGKPGALDSAGVEIALLYCSHPGMELGIQAFLAGSLDVNDDSLTVWGEWRNAPRRIPKNFEIKATFEMRARGPLS